VSTSVSLTPSSAQVTEGGSLTYTAKVASPVTGTDLVLTLTNGQTVTIPVGSTSGTSAPFAVRGDDAYLQGDQTVVVGVAGASGGTYDSIDTTTTATTQVTDRLDATTVALSASATASEGGSIVYTATLNAIPQTPVDVALSNGVTIHIAAGDASGSVSVTAPTSSGNVAVAIQAATGGNFEILAVDPNPASTTVYHVNQAPSAHADTATAVEAGGPRADRHSRRRPERQRAGQRHRPGCGRHQDGLGGRVRCDGWHRRHAADRRARHADARRRRLIHLRRRQQRPGRPAAAHAGRHADRGIHVHRAPTRPAPSRAQR
jgi:hypothetical protein